MSLGFLRCLGVCILLGYSCAASAQTIGNCPVFPANNIWNARVDNLPVHPLSNAYVNTIGPMSLGHADFGSGLYNGEPIGIPFITVPGTQPKVPVTFQYSDESDPGPYPIPPSAPIEGGGSSTGDRHVLVIDQDNCILYELYSAYPQPDGSWQAGSGAIFDLKANNLRPATWTSADAAGLPMFPGLARYDEVAAGAIKHALRFTVPSTQKAYLWPARHYASSITSTNYPPMGVRFRLKASFNISGFSPDVQVILQALKTYGMILADNGSAWYVSGAPDSRWNNNNLSEFRQLQGTDFEAVDESSLMIDPNSAQVAGSGPGYQPGPNVVSLSPTSGSGASGTFTANFYHTAGGSQNYLGYILFLPTPNIVWYTATGSCLVEYNRISNAMRLINDAGTNWLPGTIGLPVGQAGVLSNSHCTLNVGQSSAQVSGNGMTITASLTFNPGFTGVLATFLQEFDVTGAYTGMTQFGNWLVAPAASQKPGPYVVGVSPTSGSGTSTTLTFTAGHTNGILSLSFVTLLISPVIVGGAACQAFYFPATNTLNLVNDSGSAMVSANGIVVGTAGTLANSRCSINTGAATQFSLGDNVTVSLPLTFNTTNFGGSQTVHVNAFDDFGFLSHWVAAGTWTVQ